MTRPVVVVVGLGPAGPDLVTAGALEAVALPARRFLRTSRHPSSVVVDDATTFDHLYEQADTFADVYRDITDALVAAATEEGRVVYAVPGSPLVLERSVRHLLGDPRVSVEVVPGLSFLDLAYGRLGLDPIEAGLRLVDGHEFATAAAGERGPLLVAHTHAPWVLSDIKLAVDSPGSEPVVVLQRLGLPDEQVTTVAWADLDRVRRAGPPHLPVHPEAGRARRTRAGPLPRHRPQAAGRVPVGSPADPPDPHQVRGRGGVRADRGHR